MKDLITLKFRLICTPRRETSPKSNKPEHTDSNNNRAKGVTQAHIQSLDMNSRSFRQSYTRVLNPRCTKTLDAEYHQHKNISSLGLFSSRKQKQL